MNQGDGFGESEWNAAAYRIRYISYVCVELRKRYAAAIHNQTPDNVRSYFNMVQVLYEELRIYLDPEDREDIDEELETLRTNMDGRQNSKTVVNQLDKIRDVDRQLQEGRVAAGLDIPSKTEFDPESALVDGLD